MAGRGLPKGHKKYGGRKKGTPNKLTRDLKTMIENSLQKAGGEKYLTGAAHLEVAAYLTLLGKLLPKDLNVNLSGDLAERLVAARKRAGL